MRNYKKLILSLLFALSPLLLGSCTIKNCSPSYDHCVIRGITKVVYSYLKDYKTGATLTQHYKNLNKFVLEVSSEIKKGKASAGIDVSDKETYVKVKNAKSEIENLWHIVLSFFIGLLFGSISLYLIIRRKIYSILAEEKAKYLSDLKTGDKKFRFKIEGLFYALKISKDKKRQEIIELNEELNNLKEGKKTNKQANFEPSNNYDSEIIRNREEKPSTNLIENPVSTEAKELTNEYYFTIPESDGTFKFTNAKSTKEMDCFYRIEIEKNNQRAKLFFISGDYDMRALDNIDYYLNPVCDIVNISERMHARKILLINSGIVVKIGDSWKIEAHNKIKIKLI